MENVLSVLSNFGSTFTCLLVSFRLLTVGDVLPLDSFSLNHDINHDPNLGLNVNPNPNIKHNPDPKISRGSEVKCLAVKVLVKFLF